jgi:hypothetical protein
MIQHPGNDSHVTFDRTGLQQDCGNFGAGRTGRQHVIHNQNSLSANDGRIPNTV